VIEPNILFLIIDSFRSDKFFGEKKTSITPNLDKIIKQGVFFSQTISSASSSLPAISSLLTGNYPFRSFRQNEKKSEILEDSMFFLKELEKKKYHLRAFIPNILTNLSLEKIFKDNIDSYDDNSTLYDGIGNQLLERIKQIQTKNKWFFYVHLNDIHGPAIFHKDFQHEDLQNINFGKNQYERMVSLMDKWLGRIFAEIDFQNTLVVISADHGSDVGIFDEKMDHFNLEIRKKKKIPKGKAFEVSHKVISKTPKFFKPIRKILSKSYTNRRENIIENSLQPDLEKLETLNLSPYKKRIMKNIILGKSQVFDERFLIPLLFVGYGVNGNKIINKQVRSVDIFPTVFSLIDFSFDCKIHGRTLFPYFNNENLDELPAYLQSTENFSAEKTDTNVIGIRTSEYKYFRDKNDVMTNTHLYNLKLDPLEEKNVSNSNKSKVQEMEKLLKEITHDN